MQKRFLTPFLIVLVLMSYALLRPGARAALRHHQASTTASDAYVQVTSVAVEPPTMHKTQNPNTATVVVQILLRGSAPSNPEAAVEVGTASSDPPNNELRYDDPTRTVALQKGVTVVKFKAETTPKTFEGKLKIGVTLGGATKGIDIKDSEPKDYIAEVTIQEP